MSNTQQPAALLKAVTDEFGPTGNKTQFQGETWSRMHAAITSTLALNQELLEALQAMEARFGCMSSRAEEQPKTFGCRHMAETCTMCEGLVTGWKAVQAARAAIAKATGGAV